MIALHQLKIRFIFNRKPITKINNLFLAKKMIEVYSEHQTQHNHRMYVITVRFFKVKVSVIYTIVANHWVPNG